MNIPEGWTELKNVDGIYFKDNQVVITGSPESDDKSHNCDFMGCGSLSHVLMRCKIIK